MTAVSLPRRAVRTSDLLWVIRRQHRAAIVAAIIVTAVLVAALLVARLRLDGLPACIRQGRIGQGAPPCVGALGGRVDSGLDWLYAATIAPVLLGVLVAAPLLPRQFEQQTYQLTTVSSIERGRWLRTQVLAVLIGPALLGTAVALAAAPLRRALLSAGGGFGVQDGWNYQIWSSGWLLVPYAVVGCAIGLLAGAALRKTLPALIVAAVVLTALRVGTLLELRPHWWPPARSTHSFLDVQVTAPPAALVLDDELVQDSSGRLHPFPTGCEQSATYSPTVAEFDACLRKHGVTARVTTYQPASRIADFELAEAGFLLLLSAAAVAATARLQRRDPPP